MTQMTVTRNADGSHSPAYNEDWPELTQLKWHAGVIALEIDLRIEVHCASNVPPGMRLRDHPDVQQNIFRVSVKGPWALASAGAMDFLQAWSFLDGVKAATIAIRGGVLPQR
ncbi:hypothetical protein [Streptomyces collinus]|uniref:hypothetical protein n=1 Tax=Streptomyces collinus TaxID=42684 RepID=UPI00381D5BE9